ncbi:TIGR03618 family F420-dependent PPOX class oxidoreductase [Amnibacterium sp.]|uniref:TIGR03618 family F420-dependent PPOX class oxidoreductase n=1 Tax=Amnibacterium sp. TaxID=1872496 RepID=UPI0026161E6E|nr:TIGR03618 family F420-dependent PPOX class oxidoreductase [Amnibacterium sp.]
MAVEIPEDVRSFLEQPNPAVMATLAKDGRPVSVVTWYLLEPDGSVLLNLDSDRVRLRHLRRDPRIALTVLDEADWGSHVSLQLSVDTVTEDADLSDIDALATHYIGTPYPNRDRARVSARARIHSWHGWGRFASE